MDMCLSQVHLNSLPTTSTGSWFQASTSLSANLNIHLPFMYAYFYIQNKKTVNMPSAKVGHTLSQDPVTSPLAEIAASECFLWPPQSGPLAI